MKETEWLKEHIVWACVRLSSVGEWRMQSALCLYLPELLASERVTSVTETNILKWMLSPFSVLQVQQC